MRHAGPGLQPRGDPLRGLGLRPRSRHQRRPGLHRLPAPQAGAARLPGADRDRALGGLPAARSADESAPGPARTARPAGALDRGDRGRRLRASSSSPCARRWRTSRAVIRHEEVHGASEPGASQARARRGLDDLADRGRPVRCREDLPPGRRRRPWSPRCWPATCSRRGPPRRCAASPPPPPRSTPATSRPRLESSRADGGRAADPRRGLQPHARPPRRRLRPPAPVRLRRLARAAQPADRDPRPARSAGPRADTRAPPRCGGSRRSTDARWAGSNDWSRSCWRWRASTRGSARRCGEVEADPFLRELADGSPERRRARRAAAGHDRARPRPDRPGGPQPARQRTPPRRARGRVVALRDAK